MNDISNDQRRHRGHAVRPRGRHLPRAHRRRSAVVRDHVVVVLGARAPDRRLAARRPPHEQGHGHVAGVPVGPERRRPGAHGVLQDRLRRAVRRRARRRPGDRRRHSTVDLRDITFPEGGFSVKMLNAADGLPRRLLRSGRPTSASSSSTAASTRRTASRRARRRACTTRTSTNSATSPASSCSTASGSRSTAISVRDRTWGPRSRHHSHGAQPTRRTRVRVANPGGPQWREIERERGRGRIQYIFGHAWDDDGCDTGFLSFVRVQDGTADGWSPLNMGWLLQDGGFARLDTTQSRMKNYRDPDTGWSAHMEVDLVDRAGRTMQAEGVALSHNCEHGNGSNASMRWELVLPDGRTRTRLGRGPGRLAHRPLRQDAARPPFRLTRRSTRHQRARPPPGEAMSERSGSRSSRSSLLGQKRGRPAARSRPTINALRSCRGSTTSSMPRRSARP